MKQSLAIERCTQSMIEEKKSLLRDIEYAFALTLSPLEHPSRVLVRLRDASAGYEGKAVFEHLSIEIAQGERVALSGRNGCGKSTLLKLVSGTMEPLTGQVFRASGLVIKHAARLEPPAGAG